MSVVWLKHGFLNSPSPQFESTLPYSFVHLFALFYILFIMVSRIPPLPKLESNRHIALNHNCRLSYFLDTDFAKFKPNIICHCQSWRQLVFPSYIIISIRKKKNYHLYGHNRHIRTTLKYLQGLILWGLRWKAFMINQDNWALRSTFFKIIASFVNCRRCNPKSSLWIWLQWKMKSRNYFKQSQKLLLREMMVYVN